MYLCDYCSVASKVTLIIRQCATPGAWARTLDGMLLLTSFLNDNFALLCIQSCEKVLLTDYIVALV